MTVYTYKYKYVQGKAVSIIRNPKPIHYDANKGWGKYYDAYYPVDVNLYCGEGKQANGDLFYEDNDYIGEYTESSLIFGKGKGRGIMIGRMRGYGYCEYSYTIKGWGLNITAFSYGNITGKYNETRGLQNPFDLAGDGTEMSFGAYNTSGTKWRSINKNGKTVFEGISSGLTVGFPSPSAVLGKFTTYTVLLFPKFK